MKFTKRSQRRGSTRSGPSISLFPFLAVLICTMGALVPLLLAMTRTARLQAEARAKIEAAELVAKQNAALKTQRENVQWRIEQLKVSREKTAAQLADARLDLGHLEDHSRRLKTQLAQYEKAAVELDQLSNADQQQTAQAQAELASVRARIDETQRQVSQARQNATGRKRSYAIVPYEGPNQTHRRPIYLECRADAVILQPEGIAFVESDFEGPMGPSNPLASALRAAREYLLAQQQIDPQAGEPYPLLLVRPEGIAAFYAARAAMKSWGADFGYELIGDDWKLSYQAPDPRLSEVTRQATATARIEQRRLIASAPRAYERSASGEGQGAGGEGRETRGEGREAIAGGQRPAGTDGEHGAGGEGREAIAGGQRPAGASGTGYGVSGPAGSADRYITTTDRPGTPLPPGSPYASAAQSEIAGGQRPAGADEGRGAGGEGRGAGDEVAAYQRPPTAIAGVGGAKYGGSASGTYAGSGRSDIAGVERPEGYVAGQPMQEQETPTKPMPSDAMPGQPLRPGEWEPTPERPPEREEKKEEADKSGKHHKPKPPPPSQRGEDWAVRNAGRGSVGLTRPMQIGCYPDRLVVFSDRTPTMNRVVPLGPRTEFSIDPFVSAVWEQIADWGIAGRGMYWRPVLHVSVAPGGEQRFAELSSLLRGSGLTVVRR